MLTIYNSLTNKKEAFQSIHDKYVGMYVCGPTLYSEPHMGNMRTFINFDLVYRYLLKLGYRVKYVRNITDAGHITNSLGQEVDNIGKIARLEEVQSLEIVYKYNQKFIDIQRAYNLLPPSIEPTATQHIQEQIEIIEQIIANGFAYVVNNSVYFDVKTYAEKYHYGELSGRKIEELEETTRELNSQEEKRFFADFALWKKANPEDMQIWRSPWGNGNPGWHIECTAMSTKYLGSQFDIHGGGMDLKFPHHEDEIAQNCAATGQQPAKIWMHANMLNVNGQKMSKSFNNFFLPMEIIDGTSPLFDRAYSANTVRFFLMQAHYRSTIDVSNEALKAAEKGLQRLQDALNLLQKLKTSERSSFAINELTESFYDAMNDDFNAPILIAKLFDAVTLINKINDGAEKISPEDLQHLTTEMSSFVYDVLGIKQEQQESADRLSPVMDLIVELRAKARQNKDWATSDQIREALINAGITIKDSKDGTTWA